jgi:extradiol dioxygenase family protein
LNTIAGSTLEIPMSLSPFHLAIPVHDLPAARHFYGEVFGLEEGRSSEQWVDFDFYGHQLVCHAVVAQAPEPLAHTPVDGHDVPVPHFGLVLEMKDWESLAAQLKAAGVAFVIQPTIRFKGRPGEQATMFLTDPSGNALEFKAFRDIEGQLFARD